jgi:hypothetical protein
MRFSEEQKKVIFSDSSHPFLIVLASPGSGKTATMIQRYRQNKKKSIFLTFTKNTQKDIANRVKDAEVYTFDSFCYYLCDKFHLLNKNYLQMYNPGDYKVIVYLNQDKIELSDISSVFIDEIQDICFYQYQLILFLQKRNPQIQIYMTGDTKQNIFVFRNTTNLYLYNYQKYFKNAKLFTLQTNYRIQNSELLPILLNIEKLMMNPFDLLTKIPPDVKPLSKKEDTLVCVHGKNNYAESIYKFVQKHRGEQICVLCRSNNLLNKVQTDYVLNYSDKIIFSNIHCAKGMEFEVVIFIGVEKDIIPSIYSDNLAEETNLFFTAVSRAQKYLVMMYHNQKSMFLEPEDTDYIKEKLQTNFETLSYQYKKKKSDYLTYNQKIQNFQSYFNENPKSLSIQYLWSTEYTVWSKYTPFHYSKYLKTVYHYFPQTFQGHFSRITIPKKIPYEYKYLLKNAQTHYPHDLTTVDFVVLASFLLYKKNKKIIEMLEVLHQLNLKTVDIPESPIIELDDVTFANDEYFDFENVNNVYKFVWDSNNTSIQHIAFSAQDIEKKYNIIDLVNFKMFSFQYNL